jgi:hypothetical protein
MSIVETIAAAVKPWNVLYSHSKVVEGGVQFVHVGSLLLGGGFAVAMDRAVLRARSADADVRRYLLRDIAAVHRPVVVALAIMVASGAALMLADVETFLVSPVYWSKMGLFVLLLANGYLVTRTERKLAADPSPSNPLWGRFTAGAVASLTLWLATTLAGVVLTNS